MKDYPAILFVLFFAAGILIQSFIPLNVKLDLILSGLLFLTFIVIFIFEWEKPSKLISSVVLLFLIAFTGFTSENVHNNSINFLPDSVYVINNFYACGEIENVDLPGNDAFSFQLKTDSIGVASPVKMKIKLLCRIYDAKFLKIFNEINPGNIIKVKGTYRKGREVRNPGEFDYNKYLHSKDISGSIILYNINDIKIVDNRTDFFNSKILAVRKYLNKIITRLHTKETSALLKGLILADRNEIDPDTKSQFVNAGIVHILAVSGLHVGFIALIFYVISGRLNLYIRSIITIAGILLFMFITGVPASVFRSSVMAIIIIIAFLFNRTTNIYNSLALAALIILAISPAEIFTPGFQLSFAAVLSIAYFYPVFRGQIIKTGLNNKVIRYFLLFAAVSISAQIGTLPFVLYYFGKISFAAILTNIIVIPLAGIIIGTTIITIALYPISIWLSSTYGYANDFFSHVLYLIVRFAGNFKYSYIDIRNYSSADILIFYLILLTGLFLFQFLSSAKSKLILLLLIILNISLYTSLDKSKLLAVNKLNVYMIDVGQGDSFLIRFPGNKTALVDAGDVTPYFDNGEKIIIPLLQLLEINKIDYCFVSHIDSDHYSGFVSLIAKYKIGKIFAPLPDKKSDADIRFGKYIKSRNIPVEYYSKKEIRIDNAAVFILNNRLNETDKREDSNNRSGILKIVYGNTSFLFTGDLEKNGEIYYSNEYSDFLNSDVLKVAHHGSKSSSSKEFISQVSPGISLISCGINNKFGHPSKDVLQRLKDANSVIYRTDKKGGIMLQSDGFKIQKIDWENYY